MNHRLNFWSTVVILTMHFVDLKCQLSFYQEIYAYKYVLHTNVIIYNICMYISTYVHIFITFNYLFMEIHTYVWCLHTYVHIFQTFFYFMSNETLLVQKSNIIIIIITLMLVFKSYRRRNLHLHAKCVFCNLLLYVLRICMDSSPTQNILFENVNVGIRGKSVVFDLRFRYVFDRCISVFFLMRLYVSLSD